MTGLYSCPIHGIAPKHLDCTGGRHQYSCPDCEAERDDETPPAIYPGRGLTDEEARIDWNRSVSGWVEDNS